MRIPVPATIAQEVIDTLVALITSAPGYLSRDDLRVRRLAIEIDKLLKVSAADGHIAKAGVAHACGDVEAMRYHMACAANLTSHPLVERSLASCLTNLGFFSEAQAIFTKAADPRRGDYSIAIGLGLCCGAFEAMLALTEDATRMGLEIPATALAIAGNARSILAREGVRDEQVGRMLDVAGELMREAALFFQGEAPQILSVDDDDLGHCVYFTFLLAVPAERVAEMQFDLACRLVDRFPVLPNVFSVGFRCANSQ